MNKQEIIQKLINTFMNPYSPDVSEGDHLYNQGKCEGIELGFNACLTELAKQNEEFGGFQAIIKNEKTHLVISPLNMNIFPYEEIQMIDSRCLLSANARIAQLESEIDRIKSIAKNYEKRLSNYECHHGYRKDQACISSNCDVVNHTKEKL